MKHGLEFGVNVSESHWSLPGVHLLCGFPHRLKTSGLGTLFIYWGRLFIFFMGSQCVLEQAQAPLRVTRTSGYWKWMDWMEWTCIFSLTVYIFIQAHICERYKFFLTCSCTKHIFIHSHTLCAPLQSLWYGVLACLFSLPVSLSITCLLSAPKLIYLLIIHSLGMSVSDSASNLLPLHFLPPSLSSSLVFLLCLSPKNSVRTKVRSQIAEQPPGCRWVLIDKQSCAGEEWSVVTLLLGD